MVIKDLKEQHEIKAGNRFDDWAATYGNDRIFSWFEFYQNLAVEKLKISNDGNFLDVGCGTANAVRLVSPMIVDYKACGIDISDKMVEKAKGLMDKENNIEIRMASAESIPYPDEYFKYLICTCSIHHYHDPLKSICEMNRVMAKDGKLILIDPGRDVFFPIWIQDLFRRKFEDSHVRYYKVDELARIISESGLRLSKKIETVKKIMFKKKMFTGLIICEIIK